ncbi:MAG: hypothetical protein OXE49_20995 [Gemmatimonadetes bacterium]|nr:hypothetical protein [Gemmatimonadota bacterium]
MYYLDDKEKKRLVEAIRAIYAIPFVDDIEDYIWEAIFTYAKDIPSVDPLLNTRSKNLFDVVDEKSKIGWSIKAAQVSQGAIVLPCKFEVVIQRADIFTKAAELGFGKLSTESSPADLGTALLKHWYEKKVQQDTEEQGVEERRVAILLKSENRKNYVYFEEKLVEYRGSELTWAWTDKEKRGLQAKRIKDNVLIFRWYPNQKQFFERFIVPEDAYEFCIEPQRLAAGDVVEILLAKLEDRL